MSEDRAGRGPGGGLLTPSDFLVGCGIFAITLVWASFLFWLAVIVARRLFGVN